MPLDPGDGGHRGMPREPGLRLAAVREDGRLVDPGDPGEELWASSSHGRAHYGATGTGGSL